MKRKSERTAAGGMSGRERPDSARTTLSGAPATVQGAGDPGVQDSIFRAHDPSGVRDLSRGIPLIPLNPT